MIHKNLSISNFKLWNIIKIITSIFLTVALFLFLCHKLNFVYVQGEEWSHILWHDYYSSENIDNVFIGSSHVYNDINPTQLDKINGMNNFNMSSGSLNLIASYYILKEVASKNDLKNVYLELYYVPNTGINGSVYSEARIKNNWRTTTYMKPSLNKYEFIFSMSDSSYYLESLFPFIRYRSKLFDLNYIVETVEQKTSDEWKEYKYSTEDENGISIFQDKGYRYTTYEYQEAALAYNTPIDLSKDGLMPEDTTSYLIKIIEYCRKEGINLTFFISPIYETQILSAIDYDSYHQQISQIASEYSIPFYDFNLCKSQYLDIMHRELFMDAGHLNASGAEIFTPFLWEIVSNDYLENKKIFCSTYAEKISLDVPETYGVFYSINDAGKRDFTIASNRENDLEYKILLTPNDGEQYLLQDFSTNKEFCISAEEHGVLTIISKRIDNESYIPSLEIYY